MIEDKKAWTTLTVIHAHLFSYLIYSILLCPVMVKLMHFNFVYSFLFQFLITVSCVITQLLFDADKLVVLSHTVGTAHRTRLDLS